MKKWFTQFNDADFTHYYESGEATAVQIVKNLAHQTPEKKMKKKLEVRQSMKSKGELQLAKYMLGVYSQVTGIKVDGLDDDITQDSVEASK